MSEMTTISISIPKVLLDDLNGYVENEERNARAWASTARVSRSSIIVKYIERGLRTDLMDTGHPREGNGA